MTRGAILHRFADALPALNAEVLTTYPHVYPTGPLIRVKVRPPWTARALPPMVDPIGAIWLAQEGELRSVVDSAYLGMVRLGWEELQTLDLLQAADLPIEKLTPAQRVWRQGLERVVKVYRLSPSYPWG